MRSKNPRKRKTEAENTVQRAETHIFKRTDPEYRELDGLCFLSKNLYNSTLYAFRQFFFENHYFCSYQEVNRNFTHSDQPDYRALPAKVSKHTQMMVEEAVRSFVRLDEMYKNGKLADRPRLPKYLHKTDGRQAVFYEKGAISIRELKKGMIHLSQTSLFIPTRVNPASVRFVRIVPKNGAMVVEVGYTEEKKPCSQKAERVAAVDIGVNNLAAVSSNVMPSFLIDGRYIKSVNQRWNRNLAREKSHLEKRHGKKFSHKTRSMTLKRNQRVGDYLHKATRILVNQFVENGIDTLVIGYNSGWKQDTEMGRRNNQTFCQIPFAKLIGQLEYKCEKEGIRVIRTEESYTSLCSFLDNEEICRHEKEGEGSYLGRRVRRGLFRSSRGIEINADINGSLNILKKGLQSTGEWNQEMWEACIRMNRTGSISKNLNPRS